MDERTVQGKNNEKKKRGFNFKSIGNVFKHLVGSTEPNRKEKGTRNTFIDKIQKDLDSNIGDRSSKYFTLSGGSARAEKLKRKKSVGSLFDGTKSEYDNPEKTLNLFGTFGKSDFKNISHENYKDTGIQNERVEGDESKEIGGQKSVKKMSSISRLRKSISVYFESKFSIGPHTKEEDMDNEEVHNKLVRKGKTKSENVDIKSLSNLFNSDKRAEQGKGSHRNTSTNLNTHLLTNNKGNLKKHKSFDSINSENTYSESARSYSLRMKTVGARGEIPDRRRSLAYAKFIVNEKKKSGTIEESMVSINDGAEYSCSDNSDQSYKGKGSRKNESKEKIVSKRGCSTGRYSAEDEATKIKILKQAAAAIDKQIESKKKSNRDGYAQNRYVTVVDDAGNRNSVFVNDPRQHGGNGDADSRLIDSVLSNNRESRGASSESVESVTKSYYSYGEQKNSEKGKDANKKELSLEIESPILISIQRDNDKIKLVPLQRIESVRIVKQKNEASVDDSSDSDAENGIESFTVVQIKNTPNQKADITEKAEKMVNSDKLNKRGKVEECEKTNVNSIGRNYEEVQNSSDLEAIFDELERLADKCRNSSVGLASPKRENKNAIKNLKKMMYNDNGLLSDKYLNVKSSIDNVNTRFKENSTENKPSTIEIGNSLLAKNARESFSTSNTCYYERLKDDLTHYVDAEELFKDSNGTCVDGESPEAKKPRSKTGDSPKKNHYIDLSNNASRKDSTSESNNHIAQSELDRFKLLCIDDGFDGFVPLNSSSSLANNQSTPSPSLPALSKSSVIFSPKLKFDKFETPITPKKSSENSRFPNISDFSPANTASSASHDHQDSMSFQKVYNDAGTSISPTSPLKEFSNNTLVEKTFRFNETVLIYPTYNSEEYDRLGCDVEKISSELAHEIRVELNNFKYYEMIVHKDSICNTHFID
ncbi:hypothetical protein AX774_g4070 [Zancudomyces culisetae]|uniref:Uncharacterized protein n=1 Tax=Zancudomyces culisetae TaxID=1213189 RepID=A0A1R1PNB0_ZANCU|nr:hypothetical protein AX774_g4070 [Zancudomyces culisetae]|eukprot:OMH82455.1 hypothetical protein AX774_g4070 [Zancudomyces culisetae]